MDAIKQSAKDASSSFEELGKQAVEFAPKLVLAIVVLVVGAAKRWLRADRPQWLMQVPSPHVAAPARQQYALRGKALLRLLRVCEIPLCRAGKERNGKERKQWERNEEGRNGKGRRGGERKAG